MASSSLLSEKRVESQYNGVFFRDAAWQAVAKINNKTCHIGSFCSPRAAAVARDMELFRFYGEEASSELNFEYEIESSTSTKLVVIDGSGTQISVTLEKGRDYAPIQPEQRRKPRSREIITAPLCLPPSWPQQSYNQEPWAHRTQSTSAVSAAFSYEINFPFQSSLGLNLKPHSMMYPQAGGGMFVGCLTVVDGVAALASVIHPGDVLLRVNDTELVFPGHEFEFGKATKAIMSQAPPRALRFMRPYCPGVLPCPAELFALARAPEPLAKFTVVDPHEKTLQLVSAEAQLPPCISRQLQGPELPYNTCAMPKPPVRPPKITSQPIGSSAPEKAVDGEDTYVITGTIFRERIYSSGGPGAAVFANGGGPAPNGGGLVNTALGGLMISNSCVVHLGKWCAYLKIQIVKNHVLSSNESATEPSGGGFGSSFDEAVKHRVEGQASKQSVKQTPHGAPRRFFVGKFDNEIEAKINLDMASAIARQLGTFSQKLLAIAWYRKRLRDAPPPPPLPVPAAPAASAPVAAGVDAAGQSALKKSGGIISFSSTALKPAPS